MFYFQMRSENRNYIRSLKANIARADSIATFAAVRKSFHILWSTMDLNISYMLGYSIFSAAHMLFPVRNLNNG